MLEIINAIARFRDEETSGKMLRRFAFEQDTLFRSSKMFRRLPQLAAVLYTNNQFKGKCVNYDMDVMAALLGCKLADIDKIAEIAVTNDGVAFQISRRTGCFEIKLYTDATTVLGVFTTVGLFYEKYEGRTSFDLTIDNVLAVTWCAKQAYAQKEKITINNKLLGFSSVKAPTVAWLSVAIFQSVLGLSESVVATTPITGNYDYRLFVTDALLKGTGYRKVSLDFRTDDYRLSVFTGDVETWLLRYGIGFCFTNYEAVKRTRTYVRDNGATIDSSTNMVFIQNIKSKLQELGVPANDISEVIHRLFVCEPTVVMFHYNHLKDTSHIELFDICKNESIRKFICKLVAA